MLKTLQVQILFFNSADYPKHILTDKQTWNLKNILNKIMFWLFIFKKNISFEKRLDFYFEN